MISRTIFAGAILLVLFAAAVGCGPPTYTFDVTVRNATDQPVSVGLVKNGPPLEVGWDAPENVAIGAPELGSKRWGTLIPAGQTTQLKPTKGTFDPGVIGFLRAYEGDRTINELLAVSRDSSDRVDVPLDPGKTTITLVNRKGRLAAETQASP